MTRLHAEYEKIVSLRWSDFLDIHIGQAVIGFRSILRGSQDICFETADTPQFVQVLLPIFYPDLYGQIDHSISVRLSFGVACMARYVYLQDYLLDELRAEIFPTILLGEVLQYQGITSFGAVFGPDHVFWAAFHNCMISQHRSLYKERETCRKSPQMFREADLLSIYGERCAYASLGLLSKTLLSNADVPIIVLRNSMNYLSVGTQLLDDIVDLVDDYEKRNYTFLISQILYSGAFREITRTDDLPALDDLLAFVHSSNVIGETLELSSLYFDLADVLAKEIDCVPIHRYVAHYLKILETLEQKMHMYNLYN